MAYQICRVGRGRRLGAEPGVTLWDKARNPPQFRADDFVAVEKRQQTGCALILYGSENVGKQL